ncbi:hypothetical protein [Streptomyces pinistramenti]|uniref:hypothetical protein n=1 Tax=Streptomyces pinistramenti TaxID=2884812 RepID=UPI001D08579D|nr:hypothetical protein [Streptomyces pinistramenti]MCB5909815.1 hypothetical protein [Streptomyces pinistramenti]
MSRSELTTDPEDLRAAGGTDVEAPALADHDGAVRDAVQRRAHLRVACRLAHLALKAADAVEQVERDSSDWRTRCEPTVETPWRASMPRRTA